MGERKFSKVTKWEIALGAVASLMTGVVVGLVVHGRRKRATQEYEPPVMPIPPESPVDEDVFYGTVEEHGPSGMGRRRPVEKYRVQESYRTPYALGGRPRGAAGHRHPDTNRYTGNRHK